MKPSAFAPRSKGRGFESRWILWDRTQRVVCSIILSWLAITVSQVDVSPWLNRTEYNYRCYPILVNYAKGNQILGPATYQSPPKSYIAGPRQVSEATPPLSRSNGNEKVWTELICLVEFINPSFQNIFLILLKKIIYFFLGRMNILKVMPFSLNWKNVQFLQLSNWLKFEYNFSIFSKIWTELVVTSTQISWINILFNIIQIFNRKIDNAEIAKFIATSTETR